MSTETAIHQIMEDNASTQSERRFGSDTDKWDMPKHHETANRVAFDLVQKQDTKPQNARVVSPPSREIDTDLLTH